MSILLQPLWRHRLNLGLRHSDDRAAQGPSYFLRFGRFTLRSLVTVAATNFALRFLSTIRRE